MLELRRAAITLFVAEGLARVASRLVGGALMAYATVYLAQYLFSALYDNPQRVWDAMNIVTALGIVVALVVNLARARSASGLSAWTLFYANAALAVWYFHNWIRLLALAPGESVSVHHEVVWQMIGMMVPLVLATTGWRLWCGRKG